MQRGSVTVDHLKKTLLAYLRYEERDTREVAKLFTGLVERIVFLVSRVEGTLEFEVQPLREYFAARHLYETAPYSPAGAEKSGTKPDRLDAIARNAYWLNVTRFFCGCFSKGELSCIVDRLKSLSDDGDFQYTSYVRRLMAMLLSDYVFSQDQRLTREAVKIALSGTSLYTASRRGYTRRRRQHIDTDSVMILPKGAGKEEITKFCLSVLREQQEPRDEYAIQVSQTLADNSDAKEIDDIWLKQLKECEPYKLYYWLKCGRFLGSLGRVSVVDLSIALEEHVLDSSHIEMISAAHRFDYIEKYSSLTKLYLSDVKSGKNINLFRFNHWLAVVSNVCSVSSFTFAFQDMYAESLGHIVNRIFGDVLGEAVIRDNVEPSVVLPEKYISLITSANEEVHKDANIWQTSIEPWEGIVKSIMQVFGSCRSAFAIATLSAGISAASELCAEENDLFDDSKSLCKRVRYARLRAGTAAYWERMIKNSEGEDKVVCILIACAWASAKTKLKIYDVLNDALINMTEEDWVFVSKTSKMVRNYTERRHTVTTETLLETVPDSASPRYIWSLSLSCDSNSITEMCKKHLANYTGRDGQINELYERVFLSNAPQNVTEWNRVIDFYTRNQSEFYRYHRADEAYARNITPDISRTILSNPMIYPHYLVTAAEDKLRAGLDKKTRPVIRISQSEGWFSMKLEDQLEMDLL